MPFPRRMSRRQFLGASAAGAAVAGAGAFFGVGGYDKVRSLHAAPKSNYAKLATASAAPTATATPVPQIYNALHSRPDLNSAPTLKILERKGTPAPEYIFLTPSAPSPQGCAIFDNAGHLIWYRPGTQAHTLNLGVHQYLGNDVLAWYEGDVDDAGTGRGAYQLFDQSYEPLKRIVAGGGSPLDLHEFQVTDRGSILIDYYEPVKMDLTSDHGLPNTTVLNCVVQELDIASGNVLFEWRALDHVQPAESSLHAPSDAKQSFDYLHVNSIAVDTDDNLVISARNTSALYKLDRKTGDIIWRLPGGDYPDLPGRRLSLLPAGETFWFQHDARPQPDGTLTIFDDGGGPYHHNGRGAILRIDETANTATVLKEYGSDLGMHVTYQGSFRELANGNTFVGWGDIGRVTEFDSNGSVCLDATFSGNSYRALRANWKGTPKEPPALAVASATAGAQLWASWNGSTEVRQWRVLGGEDEASLQMIGVEPWQDFETAITAQQRHATYAVEALDADGKSLARSQSVPLNS